MKIYFHLSLQDFTNCYMVMNDTAEKKQALIIDPGQINVKMIEQIECDGYELCGILITHNHTNHVCGLKTINKIYTPTVYAADSEVAGTKTTLLRGDGEINVAGMKVEYLSVPGHTMDSLVYKIGNVLFTGDTITSGIIGETSSEYSKRLLQSKIKEKILSQTDETVIMPGHGPPTTVGIEKIYNLDVSS